MLHQEIVPFGRYVRLYTLHQIEGPVDLILLRIRIETLHYSFAPLVTGSAPPGREIDTAYAEDPRAGAELVRQAVLPRLQTLLDTRDPFRELGEGQEARWPRYAAARGLPAQPPRVPVIHAPTSIPRLPARSQTSERLAQIQRTLETVQTAVETASTLAALWQNWQIGRERRKLFETQRHLLHNAIQAQLDGQNRALGHALSRDFVRGYLADHAGETVYDALFGDSPESGT
jgi:hypothetical protein